MTRMILSLATALFVLAGCSSAAPTPAPSPSATPAPTVAPTVAPSPTPTLIARGTFRTKAAQVEFEATGTGSDVQGQFTMSDSTFSFTVALECTRTLPSGLILVGGTVTDSTADFAETGTRAAYVFKRGSPVEAHPDFEGPDPPAATCMSYLESIDQARAADQLDPITEGTIDLGS